MNHPTQFHIIKKLKSTKSARFNELKPEDMTSDHFNFHIKRLLESGFIEKNDDGSYMLTDKGKVLASRIDDLSIRASYIETPPKTSILFVISKEVDGVKHYVVKWRSQHPFIDHLVFPTRGLKSGMLIYDMIDSYLPFTTGLSGKPSFIGQIRRIDRDPSTQQVFNDILFLVAHISEPGGTLTNDHHDAKQFWATEEEIRSAKPLTGLPPYIFTMLNDPESPRLVEVEFDITVEQF